MKTITINIIKKSVMGVVEGLTATIAQHNTEVDFQTIWASDSEEGKLDIHYREAVNDLENELTKWLAATSTQFDLQALAGNLILQLKVQDFWPPKLSGLLSNQIQNYIVHAVMAGWLGDFLDIKTADYAGMGASDLGAIKELLLKREFLFEEIARHEDSVDKDGVGSAVVGNRATDTEDKVADGSLVPGDRASDTEDKVADGSLVPGDRASDDTQMAVNELLTVERREDAEEKEGIGVAEAGSRREDNARQHFCHERVDWSGGRPPFELR